MRSERVRELRARAMPNRTQKQRGTREMHGADLSSLSSGTAGRRHSDSISTQQSANHVIDAAPNGAEAVSNRCNALKFSARAFYSQKAQLTFEDGSDAASDSAEDRAQAVEQRPKRVLVCVATGRSVPIAQQTLAVAHRCKRGSRRWRGKWPTGSRQSTRKSKRCT